MKKILLSLLMFCLLINNVTAYSDTFGTTFTSCATKVSSYSTLGTWSCTDISGYSGYHADSVSVVSGAKSPSGDYDATDNIHLQYNSTTQYSYWEAIVKNSEDDISCGGGSCNYGNSRTEFRFKQNATTYDSVNILTSGAVTGTGFTYSSTIPKGIWVRIKITELNNNYIIELMNISGGQIDGDVVPIVRTISSTGMQIKQISSVYTGCGGCTISVTTTGYLDYFEASAPVLDGTITFDSESYNLGDIAYIDAVLLNPDYTNYGYRTIIYNPDGSINHAHMWTSGTTTQYGYSFNIQDLGTYTVKLQRFNDLFSYTDLDTDTAVGKYENDQLMSVFFNESYFSTGNTVSIQSNLSNINNSLYYYEIMILKPNGNFYNVHNITANESYSFITNVPGEWQVSLTSYPKADPSMIENQVSDYMVTYGTGVGTSWVAFNDTYYYKNSWARIDYGISLNDFYDSHKMQITNQEGTVVFDRQIIAQSGYFDYYFYESGKYTVTIDRNWLALDWDLTDNEILATDVTEVTNTIEGGFTLGVTPTTLNCGQTVYLSADTPNVWNTTNFTIRDVNDTIVKTINGQTGSWKTNQTGQFWVYLNDAGAIQDSGYFYVYGTCTGYDVMNPDGSGGIKPKPYPQTDQATSNAGLQNNFLYFMGLPIFWGMIIFIGALIVAAVNKASSAIPYLAPVILLFEAVIGLLDPYSSFIIVGFAIIAVMYFVGNFVANRAGN